MRKGMKKAIGAVITVLTTAALAVTAYAAEYAFAPTTPSVTVTTVAASTDSIKSAVDSAASSGAATLNVSSIASLPVSSSVIKALKSTKDGVLEIVSPKATISIDASTVKKVKKVDLSAKVYGNASRAVVEFRASAKKDFGCEVKITVTSCKMSAAKLKNAHVYCDGEDLGPVEIDENGYPVITVTKGGKYEIK